jgi:hypothetical protein
MSVVDPPIGELGWLAYPGSMRSPLSAPVHIHLHCLSGCCGAASCRPACVLCGVWKKRTKGYGPYELCMHLPIRPAQHYLIKKQSPGNRHLRVLAWIPFCVLRRSSPAPSPWTQKRLKSSRRWSSETRGSAYQQPSNQHLSANNSRGATVSAGCMWEHGVRHSRLECQAMDWPFSQAKL